MKKYKIKYSELFYEDLGLIVQYILDKSKSVKIARQFYEDVLVCVEERAFGADSYETFQPYEDAPDYYRIYFGNYTVFYVIADDTMDVRRILWSGMNMPKHL